MAAYRYKARDQSGSLKTGILETDGKDAAILKLDGMGFIPILVEEDRPPFDWQGLLDSFRPIKTDDLIVLSRQLATLVNAGIPLLRGIDALAAQTEHPRLQKVLGRIRQDLEAGLSLAEAFTRHPDVFDSLYVSLVRAGEAAGVLDQMLERLAILAEHDADVKSKVKSATRYPKIVVVAVLIACVVMFMFVLPKFMMMFASLKMDLPLPTRILIGLNELFQRYWWLGAMIGGGGVLAMKRYLRTPTGALWWDTIKLKLPVFGTIFLKSALSRFARVFGTLVRSGLPILETMDIVGSTVGNRRISHVVTEIRERVQSGRSIAETMKEAKLFPPVLLQLISTGEESGKLEELLIKVSQYYDRDVDFLVRRLSASLEPLLLLVVGGIVLFLALAIFMPWWNMVGAIKGG
jgi:type II secretory pathway component PulF